MTLMVAYLVLVCVWLVLKCCERPVWEYEMRAECERTEWRERQWKRE